MAGGCPESFNHALIVGKFAPLHAGHQELIETALREAGRVTVLVYAGPDFANMPQAMRAEWLRTLYPALDVREPADPPVDDSSDMVHRVYVRDYLAAHDIRIDAVYTAEDYGDGFAEILGVAHRRLRRESLVMTDDDGLQAPVSGTALRAEPWRWRRYMSSVVRRDLVHKIVLIGAESTGKSTLTVALAERFGTRFVAEYGREVWETNQGNLTPEDYVLIAEEHRSREDAVLETCRDYLFVDTNAITTLFFSYYYHRDSLPELRRLADECRDRYALVIVCDDDIPFEQDGWRDNVVWRGRMQGMVLHDLAVRSILWHVVSGPLEARIAQVVALLPALDLDRRAG